MNYPDKMLEDMYRRDVETRILRALRFNRTTDGKKYGTDRKRIIELMVKQKGNCGICEQSLEDRPWEVDHENTKTGPVVRGLLCKRCNGALLGQWEQLIPAAAWYLLKTSPRLMTFQQETRSDESNS